MLLAGQRTQVTLAVQTHGKYDDQINKIILMIKKWATKKKSKRQRPPTTALGHHCIYGSWYLW
jgi:hypothetical protein